MSRSRKKHPAGGCTTAASDKLGKRLSARAWRRRVRVALEQNLEPPHEYAVRDPWDWPKDGQKWFGNNLSAKSRRAIMGK